MTPPVYPFLDISTDGELEVYLEPDSEPMLAIHASEQTLYKALNNRVRTERVVYDFDQRLMMGTL